MARWVPISSSVKAGAPRSDHAACAATGAAWWLGTRALLGRGINTPRVVGWVVVLAAVVVAAIGVRSADPVEQFRTFKKPRASWGDRPG